MFGEELCRDRDQGEGFFLFIVPVCSIGGGVYSWLQVVLSVLVRHFTFELPDGPSTKIDMHPSLLMRPKVAGEEGPNVPLVVRRVGL